MKRYPEPDVRQRIKSAERRAMIIRSDFLTEGLFGHAFTWMLEILPYIDSKGWRPQWEIRTRNYGTAPSFNIFPDIIDAQYAADPSRDVVSFETLQRLHKHNYRHEFLAAHNLWKSYFRFPQDVYDRRDSFWREHFSGRVVLGVHYRGTDKNVDPYQTNPVTPYQFLCVVEDFLSFRPDVDAIFVASDDARFVDAMRRFPNVHSYRQKRSEDNKPIWNQHAANQNQQLAKAAILDCLTLARCQYGLKCMSQLSAFSKIMNPNLEIYRVSACKPGWFPEAYVPTYSGKSEAVQSMLRVLQRDDFQEGPIRRTTGIHRRTKRLARQLWKKALNKPLG